jgi:hypothetical protein
MGRVEIFLHIIDLDTRWRRMVSFTLQALFLRG